MFLARIVACSAAAPNIDTLAVGLPRTPTTRQDDDRRRRCTRSRRSPSSCTSSRQRDCDPRYRAGDCVRGRWPLPHQRRGRHPRRDHGVREHLPRPHRRRLPALDHRRGDWHDREDRLLRADGPGSARADRDGAYRRGDRPFARRARPRPSPWPASGSSIEPGVATSDAAQELLDRVGRLAEHARETGEGLITVDAGDRPVDPTAVAFAFTAAPTTAGSAGRSPTATGSRSRASAALTRSYPEVTAGPPT